MNKYEAHFLDTDRTGGILGRIEGVGKAWSLIL